MAAPQDDNEGIDPQSHAKGGKLAKLETSDKPSKQHGSLDAVTATSGLLVVVALAIVFSAQLSPNQRAGFAGGVLGGAAGLLVGYGVGRVRR